MPNDHDQMTGLPGGPDWNTVWMAMKERQRATPGYLSGTEFFGRAENVERYRRLAAARYDGYAERQAGNDGDIPRRDSPRYRRRARAPSPCPSRDAGAG